MIAGAFAKRGFVVLPSLDERFRTKTLMVSYGESGRRNVVLGLGYAIEITIQLVSAETGELVATTTAEGCGSTEADDIKQAITRALDALSNSPLIIGNLIKKRIAVGASPAAIRFFCVGGVVAT